MNAVSRRPEAAEKIDSEKFAGILLHIAEYEAATAERQMASAKEWLPNQRQHCAIQLFLLGNALPEFQDAARWRESGLRNVQESGILPDGSDMEQSFNYNADLPNKLAEMMTAARQLPEKEREPLLKQLEELYRNRCYFLHSLARPDGALPIAGKNNTWRDYGKPRQAMPGLSLAGEFFPGSNEARNKRSGLIADFTRLPLSKQIREFVYEKRGTPPAFGSITFPFGGWSVLRSGWDSDALYAFLKSSRPGIGHWREGGNGLEIFALGQALVVNSGGEMYHPDPRMNEYWNATVAHNSISVDGCGQKLKLDAEVPRVWKTTTGDRFLAGREFDLVEGRYTGKYAGWNFYRDGANVTEFNRRPYREIIDDFTHHRTVILVKSAGLFVVRDTVESPRNHLFTQSWLLAPEYTPEQLRIEGNCVATARPDAVNAAFYFYGIAPAEVFDALRSVPRQSDPRLGRPADRPGKVAFHPCPPALRREERLRQADALYGHRPLPGRKSGSRAENAAGRLRTDAEKRPHPPARGREIDQRDLHADRTGKERRRADHPTDNAETVPLEDDGERSGSGV